MTSIMRISIQSCRPVGFSTHPAHTPSVLLQPVREFPHPAVAGLVFRTVAGENVIVELCAHVLFNPPIQKLIHSNSSKLQLDIITAPDLRDLRL